MAKKKSRKKHQFKQSHVQLTAVSSVGGDASQQSAAPKATKLTKQSAVLAGVDDFSYVGQDVRRILLLAVGFIALQLVLWLLFNHTGLGPRVYHWFSL